MNDFEREAKEAAFQETLTAWDNKSASDRHILSPRRHFFHSGYDVGYGVALATIAAQREVITAAQNLVDSHEPLNYLEPLRAALAKERGEG